MRTRRRCWLYILVLAFSTAVLLPSPTAGASKKDEELAPSGLALFQEKMKSYPPFEEEKFKAEAESKFKLAKIGDEVTVKHRGGQASGVLRSIDKKSLQVGDKTIFFMDMDAREIARFSEEKCKELRAQHIKIPLEVYDTDKAAFEEKIRKELTAKYPSFGKKRLTDLFGGIKDKALVDSLAAAFAELYDKSLPIVGGKADHLAKQLKEFADKHKELAFDGKSFRPLAEVEEEKKLAEAEAKRTEELRQSAERRLAERCLMPKTASPVFTPDGGPYAPGQKVELSCPTPGVTIRYTIDGKDPTEESAVYAEPIILNSSMATVKAKAFHPAFNDSETATSSLCEGVGLAASYFDKINCTGATINRVDKKIDFKWTGKESPDAAIAGDCFSAIWTGSVTPKRSENYKFHLVGDDGVRLWIGDALLIDQWNELPAATEFTAEQKMVIGEVYDIKVAMCRALGNGVVKLEWSSPTTPREVIPQSCLFPEGKYCDQINQWNQVEKASYVNRKEMVNPVSNGKTTILQAPKRKNPRKDFKLE